jgi:hypothetical protein
MTCATLTPDGSLTERAPAIVASPEIGLLPVYPWQLAQASA